MKQLNVANKLNISENHALKAIINEYERYKEAVDVAMDEADEMAQAYDEQVYAAEYSKYFRTSNNTFNKTFQ